LNFFGGITISGTYFLIYRKYGKAVSEAFEEGLTDGIRDKVLRERLEKMPRTKRAH
jgi:hypothetical protein